MAITIFWLGKVVKCSYDGPQLDLTAFADLVNYNFCRNSSRNSSVFNDHNDNPEDFLPESFSRSYQHKRQESADSGDRSSSAYGSLPSEPKTSQSSEHLDDDIGIQHTRDNSIDSFISEDHSCTDEKPSPLQSPSETKSHDVTEDVFHTTMPSIYDTANQAYSSRKENDYRYSATYDSMYPRGEGSDKDISEQRSSPNLSDTSEQSKKDYDRFRYGSTEAIHSRFSSSDSLENRNADHSRQSSGSGADFLPPGRTGVRKTSLTINPLQFIAPAGNKLSDKAKETIEIMEEQKIAKAAFKEEDNDWQSVSRCNVCSVV